MLQAPYPGPNAQITSIDTVTGFLGRRGGFVRIAKLASQASFERPLAVFWISLDRFKQINTSFGHHCGDGVLFQLALRLRNNAGAGVEWCRMASDEFVCFAPDCDSGRAHQLAYELLRVIEAPLPVGDLLLHLSASIGIAMLEPGQENPLACIEHADRAMAAAKRAGGGRVVISGNEPVPGRLGVHLAQAELELENDLHIALENGGLKLYYQPIVNLDGRTESIEALMRCTTSDGNISPTKFIPIAEKTGLIVRLGDWSLFAGASFAGRLNNTGQQIKVAINVSHVQLAAPNFSQALHAALLCADVKPELIELELAESLFIDTSALVQANMRAARDAGIGLSIDDFGIGHLHPANLKAIPATKIKLDRAFVKVLPHDRRVFAAVKTLMQLSGELGMEVIAKGVEEQSQLDALREAGVHAIQGYIHAPPMPEETLLEWLQQPEGAT